MQIYNENYDWEEDDEFDEDDFIDFEIVTEYYPNHAVEIHMYSNLPDLKYPFGYCEATETDICLS